MWTSGTIQTPKGEYSPLTDDLLGEIKKAAAFAGLSKYRVFLNGTEVATPKDLSVSRVSLLTDVVSIKAAGYDTAA